MTLVEGFDDDAVALARLLAAEGRAVTLAGSDRAQSAALELRSLGVAVRERAELDRDPGEHDEAFLDVWTPEVAPRVARLRASGCRLRCLADLVLERARTPSLGVTGTAGKTTTTAFLVQLLREAGVEVHSSTARAGNLWPTAELLGAPDTGIVVMELTSSHLCFTTRSPTIAVVTSFGPTTSSSTGRSSATARRRRRSCGRSPRRTRSSSTRTTATPSRSPRSPRVAGSPSHWRES